MTPSQLTALRKRIGNQSEVADLLGVSVRTLRTAENDETYPRRLLITRAMRDLAREQGVEAPA